MFWDKELIRKVLKLFMEHPVLWDVKNSNLAETKELRLEALNDIKEKLKLPLTTDDISRKCKTMRAAYQVEMRNINAAKMRGFFYKPTLHWFDVYHDFMTKVADKKAVEEGRVKHLQEPNNSKRKVEASSKEKEDTGVVSGPIPIRLSSYAPVKQSQNILAALRRQGSMQPGAQPMELEQEWSSEEEEEEEEDEESGDEFQTFADHIAEQLRSLSVHRAVMIQNKIQRAFARQRDDDDDFEP